MTDNSQVWAERERRLANVLAAARDTAKFDLEQALKLGLHGCACSLCKALQHYDAFMAANAL